MSDQPIVESKSSIKVTRNAKGEPQFEVKVVEGADQAALDLMRTQAVGQYQALGRELGVAA